MRLHNRGAGLRRRLEVLKPGVIGGLLALLMLVAAACDDKAQPAGPTATGESPGTGAQTQQIPSITTSVQGGMWGDARMAARRLAWERLARSLLSCVSSSHRSNSVGPNRSRGSISRTTR